MTLTSSPDDEETVHPVLEPWLDFLQLCIEDPVRAARRVAMRLSVAAAAIMTLALLAGTAIGLGVAFAYVASAWAVLLLVKVLAGRGDDS